MIGIHLHDLIAEFKDKSGRAALGANVRAALAGGSLSPDLINMEHKKLSEAVCFLTGSVIVEGDIDYEPSLIRLPFNTIWVELDVGDGVVHGVLATQDDKVIELSSWQRAKNRQWIFLGFSVAKEGEKRFLLMSGPDEKDTSTINSYTLNILRFLNFLNCNNVSRTEHKPSEKLAKARRKRGKQPLFSYWTLDLKQETRGKGEPLGGSHSPPRLHLRRGHPRQYSPGKWCWVQPCVVGNKEAGIVQKDYRIAV